MDGKTNANEFKVGGITAHMTLLICSLLYMVNYMDRQVLSAVLEPMKLDLGLTDTQAGAIQTIFLLSIALFSFPISYMVDRWSRRKSLGIMAIIWSAFTYVTGLGRGFFTVIIPRTVVGVGEAAFAAAGTAMIGAAYDQKKRSRVMGVFSLFVPLGAALGVLLGGYVSANYGGWRTPFYVFAIPGIILGIAAFFLRDYRTAAPADGAAKAGFFRSGMRLFRIPTLRWMYLGQAMHNIAAFSFLAWAPAFLMRAHNIPEDKAGMITALVAVMAIFGAPLGGFLADAWYKRKRSGRMLLPAIADIFATVCLVGAYLLKLEGLGLVLGIMFGFLITLGLASLSAVSQDVVNPGQKGMSWGMSVFSQYIFGGGWGPILVGFLSQRMGGTAEDLMIALVFSALFGFVASVFFFMSAGHYPSDMDKVGASVLMAEK